MSRKEPTTSFALAALLAAMAGTLTLSGCEEEPEDRAEEVIDDAEDAADDALDDIDDATPADPADPVRGDPNGTPPDTTPRGG